VSAAFMPESSRYCMERRKEEEPRVSGMWDLQPPHTHNGGGLASTAAAALSGGSRRRTRHVRGTCVCVSRGDPIRERAVVCGPWWVVAGRPENKENRQAQENSTAF
jgi:hypothetical protein